MNSIWSNSNNEPARAQDKFANYCLVLCCLSHRGGMLCLCCCNTSRAPVEVNKSHRSLNAPVKNRTGKMKKREVVVLLARGHVLVSLFIFHHSRGTLAELLCSFTNISLFTGELDIIVFRPEASALMSVCVCVSKEQKAILIVQLFRKHVCLPSYRRIHIRFCIK